MDVRYDVRFFGSVGNDQIKELALEKLEGLSKKFQWIVSAKVNLKDGEGKGATRKICEIELSAPGPRIFASSQELTYELAINETIKDLQKQLVKRKEQFTKH